MTTQHTPGPWQLDTEGRLIETGYPVDLRGSYEHICDLRVDIDGNINEANAALIVAAPELLAALEAIAGLAEEARLSVNAVVEATSGLNQECAASVTRGYCLTMMRAAEAAFRKATQK